MHYRPWIARDLVSGLAALGMASVGNSDAHSCALVGSGVTRFLGRTAADLRRALERGLTQAETGRAAGATAIAANWAPRYLLRCLGWVAWSPASDAPVRLGYRAHRLSPSQQI